MKNEKKNKNLKILKFLIIQKVFSLLSQKTKRSEEIFKFREQRRRIFSIFASETVADECSAIN